QRPNQRNPEMIGSHRLHVHFAAISPDGAWGATIADSQLRLFSLPSTQEVLFLDRGVMNGLLRSIRFSDDSSHVIIDREEGLGPVRLPIDPYRAAQSIPVRE